MKNVQLIMVLALSLVLLQFCAKESELDKLDKSKLEALAERIESATGNEVEKIENIQTTTTDEGTYRMIHYLDTDGHVRSFTQSTYVLMSTSSNIIFENAKPTVTEGASTRTADWCLEIWCEGECNGDPQCNAQGSGDYICCNCDSCGLHIQWADCGDSAPGEDLPEDPE